MVINMSGDELKLLVQPTLEAVRRLGWNVVLLALHDALAGKLIPAAVSAADPARQETLQAGLPPEWREPASGWLSVPLDLDGEEVGWLAVSDPAEDQPPGQQQILELLARQLAMTVRQARLYQQARDQAVRHAVLTRMVHTIGQHLDMNDLFNGVIEQLRTVFEFERASIILREEHVPHGKIFALHETRGTPFNSDKAGPLENLGYARIITDNQPYEIVSDLSEEHLLAANKTRLVEEGVRSYACLPLMVWGQVIGTFNLASTTPGAFGEQDAHLLLQVADHVDGAVWNALLYDLEQRRHHTANALARLAQIVNSTLELDTVLKLALEQLARVLTFDSAAISLIEGENLRITACRGFDHPETLVGAVFRVEENNISHQVMRLRKARVEADVQRLTEWGHNRDDIEGAHTIRAWIGVPLVVKDRSIGILSIDKHEPNFYTDEDGETATAFAAQIATAIQNARLYKSEHRKRQTAAALAELSRIINSTLDLEQVLELGLEQLGQVVQYDSASILLLDGTNLVIAACRGFQSPDHVLGAIIHPDEANYGYGALLAQKTRLVADVKQEPEWDRSRDYIDEILAIRSWLGAPLVVRGKSIGVLTIDKHEPDFYTGEDAETATTFAAQLATAIHNARLYQAAEGQRDRLTAILTDTTDAVIVLDDSGQIWLLNPAAQRYLKIRQGSALGQPVNRLSLPELNAAFDNVRQTRFPMMTEIPGPDGTTLQASIAPVRDVGWVIVMQDITPLKELDRLRTDWVAAVSHDLKNPIQVVQLGAALLEIDGPLNADQIDRVRMIQRSAIQLSDLVTNVLDLARLEAGPPLRLTSLSPFEVIHTLLSEMEHLAAKKAQRLVTDFASDLPPILGDSALLRRVLSNLIGNAIKYTPSGGEIVVRVREASTSLEIQVIDNGPGIPDEALPYLFDRFYRVPGTDIEGTGLGLSIVKSIVEKHNGYVQVSSSTGKGSTFTISLPLARTA